MNYNFNNNCKFTSFLVTCLNNRFRAEQQCLFHNIRKLNIIHENIDDYNNLANNFNFDIFNLSDYDLTETEITQATFLLNGYSVIEIAKIFGVSKVAAYKRNKKIGKKLLNKV